ncbi:N-acetylmuramoyl-L-alanine amidase [Corynebacterium sp.]|uniref:N-acetylmuramoyl-L-alanine amidase n=1 Tax=Corynebacterium sp. TaxID=1720 RepID=UPI0026DACE7B|nr:N-acetylmuramoyl-L-alanine amidase [Corynebacterium sp.]MDO5077626.1 N-acetylmuramoyl-L-alanine amidase [Corynebacterium sp.]
MTEVFKVGDENPRIAEVRAALARLGFIDEFKADASSVCDREYTVFDAHLSEALRAFQQSRGLIADGQIRDATLRTLQEASYKLGTRVLTYQPPELLSGNDVLELQTELQDLGFYLERLDGHYGELTHQAVVDYQFNYGLKADGVCGPETLRSLSYLGRRITGGAPHAVREREAVRAAGPFLAGKRVVIDPGPHNNVPGHLVRGPYGTITEEDILWDLASRIRGRMSIAGMETIVSRPRMTNPTIKERIDLANSFNADLMISLQCDYYHNERAAGCASFYFGSYQRSAPMGELLSGFIQREICARTSLASCGTIPAKWDVLRLTRMTSVDVSVGYLSNPHDVAVLTDPKQRDNIAEAVVVAVKRLYLLDQDDQPTGTYNFSELLKAELL